MNAPFTFRFENYQITNKRPSFRFEKLVDLITCNNIEEIAPALQRIEQQVRSGLHAAGFIAYEAAAAFDPAHKTHSHPGVPLLQFGLFEQRVTFDATPQTDRLNPTLQLQANTPESAFIETIDFIKHKIREGATYQVNYTFQLSDVFQGDPRAFYQQLCNNQRSAYSAYIEDDTYCILSLSPELFFSWKNGEFTTKPMKGTGPRGLTFKQDQQQMQQLFNSKKDRAENVMIVDLLRNDLNRIAMPGSVHVPALFEIERYPSVLQMTSTVKAQVDPATSFWRIFAALFPCGSITGAPKIETMKIISEIEKTPRGVYTGAIGYFSPGPEALFNVAIRTAVIEKATHRVTLGVGAGITILSDPKSEYAESLAKSAFLSRIKPDFKILESMLLEPGKGVFMLERHLKRLEKSAVYFQFTFPDIEIRQALLHLKQQPVSEPQKIRLLLAENGIFELHMVPVKKIAGNVVRLHLAQKPVSSQDVFLYHKTTHRAVYDAHLADFPDVDDVLLFNENSELTETCFGNIILEIDGTKYTPPVECGLLAGTYRELLLENGEICERKLHIEDLKKADTVILINSVRKQQRCELALPV